MYSILHVSDLHRSSIEPISNETLIAALQADLSRMSIETPEIQKPDAMVVSGDIIEGTQLGQSNYNEVLKKQYAIAEDFLVRLTERLFDGDRTRVVLVPGNHDCCWNTAFSGMTLVEKEEEPIDLMNELEASNTPFRWNWQERKLYKISNPDAYMRKLDSYWDFAEKFYSESNLTFPIQRNTGYNLFELDEGKILMAAFESLHGNDCFSYQASFNPGAVASAALKLQDQKKYYNLRVAIWHHGLHSQPSYRLDYVPINSVYELIGHGFQLGLHGHQHFAEIGSHYVRVPGDQQIAVVSAGSLCAGTRELPRGVNRQYNIVVVSDDYSEARIHVREMTRGNHFAPSGGASGFANGFVRMQLSSTKMNGRLEVDVDHIRRHDLILRAESNLKIGCPDKAFKILNDVDCRDTSYERKLLIQAAMEAERWEELTDILSNPKTEGERIQLIEALIQTNRNDDAMTHLQESDQPRLADHIRRELQERLERLSATRRRSK